MAGVEKIARESDNYPNYEGRTGASAREMKLVIMNAAQSTPLRVPVAVRDLRRAGGPGARRDRVRVPEAGAAAGRLPREPQVHLPGARPADRQDRRRGADVDGPGRRAALHGAVRALRRARVVLGQAREGAEPDHRPRRGSRRGHDGGGRAHPAGDGTARRVPARGDQPHRRLVDRSPAPEARLRRDLPAPDRRAARVVLRGAQEAGPQDQRGPAGLPGRRPGEDAARRGRGGGRDARDDEVALRLLRQLRQGRRPGADPQALQLTDPLARRGEGEGAATASGVMLLMQ